MYRIRMTEPKIAHRLRLIDTLIYQRRQPLPPFRFHAGDELLIARDVVEDDWPVIEPGACWGKSGQDFTLRTSFLVPDDWQMPIEIIIPFESADEFIHPEALAYIDGIAYQGVNAYHREISLSPCWCDQSMHTLALNGWFGTGGKVVLMGQPVITQIHQPTRDFLITARVALGVVNELGEDDPTRSRLLNALDEALLRLNLNEPFGEDFYRSIDEALEILYQGIAKAGSPLPVNVVAVGHTHLDIAWLWSAEQTRRKAERTFTSVLQLLEQYPKFHFTYSQPQIYRNIAEDRPDLFEQIQSRVVEGRWEVVGGMWVEADCNLIGAESLVRQLLLGRSFFRQNFGEAEAPILWLPDTFGFPWTLPQLIKAAGLKYLMTAKLSWNQYNRLPYDSFWWQGLDGTRVLTHFVTTPDVEGKRHTTYNSDLTPRQIFGTWRNYQQKEMNDELLVAFGWGDGGGGPTRGMLENSKRLANHPGAPRVHLGRADKFFEDLEERTGHQLPVWNDELYLEYHRGTYTSQARVKRANRKAESLLHDAEFLAVWATLATDYKYPHTELTRAWRLLCRNQFHDIICGACIGPVYEESDDDYQVIDEIGEWVRETSLEALSSLLPKGSEFIVINPTSFGGRRTGLLPERINEGVTPTNLATGQPVLSQLVNGGTLIEVPDIDPYGVISLGLDTTSTPQPEDMPSTRLDDGTVILENSALRVEFNLTGDIIRLYDKDFDREVLPSNQRANIFQAFEDRPLKGDAWNVEIFYDDKQWGPEPAYSLSFIELGPLRSGVEIRRRILNSEILQRVYLCRGGRRLDFDTWVDWRERNVMLKVAFPVNILSPEATYDIQWGNIRRPTHRNTSWDWARFETCGHKWVDLSEGNYGVSLINDCKYGHDVQDNMLRITLLRGPTYPDPDADLGEHHFIYSLLPHVGDWRMATVPASYALNDPLIVRRITGEVNGGSLPQSLVFVDTSNVIIETVKQAEDDRGIIIRLFENERSRGPVNLQAGFPLAKAYQCNLLEEKEVPLEVSKNGVNLNFTPYQIMTLRLISELDKPRE